MIVHDDITAAYLAEVKAAPSPILVRPSTTSPELHRLAAAAAAHGRWAMVDHAANNGQLPPDARKLIYAAGDDALQQLMDLAERVATRVTDAIGRPPMSLEFEALFDNYRLFSKKRCAHAMHAGRPNASNPRMNITTPWLFLGILHRVSSSATSTRPPDFSHAPGSSTHSTRTGLRLAHSQ